MRVCVFPLAVPRFDIGVMDPPIKIIGISDGSGAGKTTLAKALTNQLNDRALILNYDRYYCPIPCGNYDLPEALDTAIKRQSTWRVSD
jgi:uridine kinase